MRRMASSQKTRNFAGLSANGHATVATTAAASSGGKSVAPPSTTSAKTQWSALATGNFLDDDVLDISSESVTTSSGGSGGESDDVASDASLEEDSDSRDRNATAVPVAGVPTTTRNNNFPVNFGMQTADHQRTTVNNNWTGKSAILTSAPPSTPSSFSAIKNGMLTKKPQVVTPLKITIKKDANKLSNGDTGRKASLNSVHKLRTVEPVHPLAPMPSISSPVIKPAFFPRKSAAAAATTPSLVAAAAPYLSQLSNQSTAGSLPGTSSSSRHFPNTNNTHTVQPNERRRFSRADTDDEDDDDDDDDDGDIADDESDTAELRGKQQKQQHLPDPRRVLFNKAQKHLGHLLKTHVKLNLSSHPGDSGSSAGNTPLFSPSSTPPYPPTAATDEQRLSPVLVPSSRRLEASGVDVAALAAAEDAYFNNKFGKHATMNLLRAFRTEIKGNLEEEAKLSNDVFRDIVERSATPPIARNEGKEFESVVALANPPADLQALVLSQTPLNSIATVLSLDDDELNTMPKKASADDHVKIDLILPYQQSKKTYHRTPMQLVADYICATKRSRPLESNAEESVKQIKCRMMNLSRFPKQLLGSKQAGHVMPLPVRVNRGPIPRVRRLHANGAGVPSSMPSSSTGGSPANNTGDFGDTSMDGGEGGDFKPIKVETLTPSAGVPFLKPKNKGGRPKGWRKFPNGKFGNPADAANSLKRPLDGADSAATINGDLPKKKKKKKQHTHDQPNDVTGGERRHLIKSKKRKGSKHLFSSGKAGKKKTIKISSKFRPTSSMQNMEPFGNVLPSPANFSKANAAAAAANAAAAAAAAAAVTDAEQAAISNAFPAVIKSGGQMLMAQQPALSPHQNSELLDSSAALFLSPDIKSSSSKKKKGKSNNVYDSNKSFVDNIDSSIIASSERRPNGSHSAAGALAAQQPRPKKKINLSSFVNKHTRESRRARFWADIIKQADKSRFKAEYERRRLRELALKKVNCRIDRMHQPSQHRVQQQNHQQHSLPLPALSSYAGMSERLAAKAAAAAAAKAAAEAAAQVAAAAAAAAAAASAVNPENENAINEALMLAHKDYIRIVTKDVPKRAKEFIDLRRKLLVVARRAVDACRKQWEFKTFGGADGETPSNTNIINVHAPAFQELKWRSIILRKKAATIFRKRIKSLRHSRKQREKEEVERVKREMEVKEQHRQQRKLNFLLTQTELYAHFVSRKCGSAAAMAHETTADANSSSNGDVAVATKPVVTSERDILRHLDAGSGSSSSIMNSVDPDEQLQTDMVDFGGDAKEVALNNVREAIERTRQRALEHDRATLATAAAGAAPAAAAARLDAAQLKQNYYGNEDEDARERERKANLVEVEQPAMLVGELKHYQLKGIGWLLSLYENGINGILADEMGLGKTIQTIAFLGLIAEKYGIWGPFLVVAPASTLHNWYQECSKFLPKFKTLPYWGTANERQTMRKFWAKKDMHTADAQFHIVITSYQLAVLDASIIKRVNWQFLVLDEAQAIKSSASMRWNALLSFPCRNRLLLTGTPVQNTMAELWALLHFIMPTLFDSHAEFDEWFSRDIEGSVENKRAMEEKNLTRLHMILKPFMLRRTKKEVEHELGEKIEKLVPCPLSMRQQRLYQSLRNRISMQELMQQAAMSSTTSTTVRGGNKQSNNANDEDAPAGSLLNLVMQFRKVCNHPELFERRDVSSPLFAAAVPEFVLPRLVFDMPSSRNIYHVDGICRLHAELDMWLCSNDAESTVLPFKRLLGLSAGDLGRVSYDREYRALALPDGGRLYTLWRLQSRLMDKLKRVALDSRFNAERVNRWNAAALPLLIREKLNPFSYANLRAFDRSQVLFNDNSANIMEQLVFTNNKSYVPGPRSSQLISGLVNLVIGHSDSNKEPTDHRKMREKRQWLLSKLKDRVGNAAGLASIEEEEASPAVRKIFANGLIEVVSDNSDAGDELSPASDAYITPADIEREAFGYMGRNKRRHGPGNRGPGRYINEAESTTSNRVGGTLRKLEADTSQVSLDASAIDDDEFANALMAADSKSTVIPCLALPLPNWVAFYSPSTVSHGASIYCDDARFTQIRGQRRLERHLLSCGLESLNKRRNSTRHVAALDVHAKPILELLPAAVTEGLLGAVTAIDKFSNIRLPDRHHLITDSGKLRVLDRLLRQLKAEGHRVLLYSQMTRMIDLLEEFIKHKHYRYLRLDGSSSLASRRDMVSTFQSEDDVFIFLLSTRAGGLGINLTGADTVIFFDSDWNPTVDQQAMDRAHRLGQTKQVTVYRLVCHGTIEERILMRAQQKSEIQQMVIEGGDFRLDSAASNIKQAEVVSLLLDENGSDADLPMLQTLPRKFVPSINNSMIGGRDPRGRFTLGTSLRR